MKIKARIKVYRVKFLKVSVIENLMAFEIAYKKTQTHGQCN